MAKKTRIILAVLILAVLIAVVLGVDIISRKKIQAQLSTDIPAGSIPIQVDGNYIAHFVPDDLVSLSQVSFIDEEEGKTQEGWLLSDVLFLYLDETQLGPDVDIFVSSSSRGKTVNLGWNEVANPENMVMFDLAGRGTLKLVSKMVGFNTRDDWVQDVDLIEVNTRR